MTSASHLVIAPVLVPLIAAAVMLLIGDRSTRLKSIVNVGATFACLVIAVLILLRVDGAAGQEAIGVYLAANWEAPFGIVLVVDRLSALMLVLAGIVSLAAAVYATAGWSRAGVYFHALFQVQVMGLNGAFLAGDLFNLFVFFEVMLAASYGLQLHGSGWTRVRSGLHYIAVNLLASSLFLVGLAVLYGVMGTLSMADVAAKIALVDQADRGLLHAGTAILAVAFLVKAAVYPLNAWLVPAYAAASAPVGALFALMTKVGVYTLLRLWMLLFSPSAGPSEHFGAPVLIYGGLATMAFGVLGLTASMRLGRIAGYSVIVSSGTLLAAIGLDLEPVTSAALYYLLSATLAVSALFLLVELVERTGTGHRVRLLDLDVDPTDDDTNLDDDETPLVGRTFPVSMAVLGLAFIACSLLVAGLPPLSGFVAKFALLRALLEPAVGEPSTGLAPTPAAWALFALLLLSALTTTVAMSRVGIRWFWAAGDRRPPHLKVVEGATVLTLIAICAGITVAAEPVLRYTRATAAALHAPATYVDAVLSTRPKPGPTRPDVERTTRPARLPDVGQEVTR